MSVSAFINQYSYLILFFILVIAFIIILIIWIRGRNGREPTVIINNNKEENMPEQYDEDHKKYIGALPEEVVQKMFGLGAKIKNWILAIVIAIPLYIVAYIVAGYFAVIAVPISIVILWWAAAHWVKINGVRLIYDGDIDPDNPKAGVEHIDYLIPYEQFKMLSVSDLGGSYPIKSLDGLAYRVERIEFWDAKETIVKKIWFSWQHGNDSNFENKHSLFHFIAEWLKDSIEVNTIYETIMEILALQKAKDVHTSFENAKNIAMNRPAEANERISKLLGRVKTLKKEMDKIEKATQQTQDKPWVDRENNNSENAGEGNGGGE